MFSFTNEFMSAEQNIEFLKTNMMGPNAMRVAEELASYLSIKDTARVLDLGCGAGLSTLLLVEKYATTVFAADLWISPTENYKRFKALQIDDKAVPIFADATEKLPFAEEYFDVLFSVDAYHYFGHTKEMLPALIPFVKKGGYIAVAVPGLQREFQDNVPEEMQPFWNSDMERTLHSLAWWENLWSKEKGIEIISCREMDCHQQAWEEWLTAYHSVVAGDRKMMEAENGQHFNLIQLIAKVI